MAKETDWLAIALGVLGLVAVAKILDKKKCTSCGAQNSPNSSQCTSCGGTL